MAYTFHIYLNGSEVREIMNYNKELSFIVEPERGMVMREHLSNEIECCDGDYNWLKDLYLDNIKKYTKYQLVIKKDNVYRWHGEFLPINLEFLKSGIARIKPSLIDGYTTFMGNYEKNYNILENTGFSSVRYNIIGYLEFYFKYTEDPPANEGWEFVGSVKCWTLTGYVNDAMYSREIIKFQRGELASTTGWDYIDGDDDILTYARGYSNAFPSLSTSDVFGTRSKEDGGYVKTDSNYSIYLGVSDYGDPRGVSNNYFLKNTFNRYNSLGYYINKKGIKLKDMLTGLVKQVNENNSSEIISTFFFNDKKTDGTQIGTNYVSGESNILNNLCVIYNADLKRPEYRKITKVEFSFKDIFDSLNSFFKDNLFWVKEGNNIRIEHLSYLDDNDTIILDNITKTYKNTTSFSSDHAAIYNRELMTSPNSESLDWLELSINYDVPLINGKQENIKEYATSISTDINPMLSLRNFDDKGLTLIRCSIINDILTIIESEGVFSGQLIQNCELSLINILEKFNNTFMVTRDYNAINTRNNSINGNASSLSKVTKQEGVKMVYPLDINYYNNIRTDLGNGRIKKLVRNIYNDIVELELIY